MNFPNLPKSTKFPDLQTVDVYSYQNNFVYTRWGEGTKINLYAVSWDNEVNAIWFDDETKRDLYFESIESESIELTTALQMLPDGTVKLPIPFDVLAQYNYIEVIFPDFTSLQEPIDYEKSNGVKRWYYFIDSIEMKAPSATLCNLTLDSFVTFSSRIKISNMLLDRGHYPVANTDVDAYLSDPISNNGYLLAPDISLGSLNRVSAVSDIVLNNGTMYGVFATTADIDGSFGSKANNNWQTPSYSWVSPDGIPGLMLFAIPASNLSSFFNTVNTTYPQFLQTIQAFYLVSDKLIQLVKTHTLFGYTVYTLSTKNVSMSLIKLDKSKFGYPKEYADLAKLYTYPYAMLEITNERGQTTQIQIEDTTGTLNAYIRSNFMPPYMGIIAYILGYGAEQERSIVFNNLQENNAVVEGAWYKTLMEWSIPSYQIVQSNAKQYDYSSFYERKQQKLSIDNSYQATVNSANTGKTNADASADTSVTNTANSGRTSKANQALSVAANASTVATSNAASTEITRIGNATNQAAQAYDAGLQRGVQEADAQAVGATTMNNALAGTLSGAVQGFASGGPAGAVAGLVGGVANGVLNGVNASVMLNAASEKVELSISNSQSKVTSTNSTNTSVNNQQTQTQTTNTQTMNNASTSQNNNNVDNANANAQNSANTAKANAKRSQDTAITNAGLSKTTGEAGITAGINQAGLGAPAIFGNPTGDIYNVAMPQVISANVVTQPMSAIAQVGDQFLRYGYMLNRYVQPTKMQIMKSFSYWQSQDVTITPSPGVIKDAIMDIKQRFAAGITLWSKPSEIGKVTIYDN